MQNAITFKKNLVYHSISPEFSEAKTEWEVVNICKSQGSHCICGKEIANVYIIYNKFNDATLEIGCDCANHIKGTLAYDQIAAGKKIINKLQKYKNEADKESGDVTNILLDVKSLYFLHNDLEYINKKEYIFMTNMIGWKNKSIKQLAAYKIIMNRLVNKIF